jgi:hypothetical protein
MLPTILGMWGQADLELADSLKNTLVLVNAIWQEDFWVDKRMVKVLEKIKHCRGQEGSFSFKTEVFLILMMFIGRMLILEISSIDENARQ